MGQSKTNNAPKGLIVDLVTPLTDGGGLDSKGLKTLLSKVLPYSTGVLLAGPTMGEGRQISQGLKTELLGKAAKFIDGKAPIFFWISERDEDSTMGLLAHLESLLISLDYKGPVFWLDSPLYYHSNRGLFDHYIDVVSKTMYPLVIYNDPLLVKSLNVALKRNNIRTNIIRDLGKIDLIKALIHRGPLSRVHNYQKNLSKRTDFRVYDGDEASFLEHPSLSGVLSAGANIAPKIWYTVTMTSLGLSKEKRDQPDYFEKILEMRAVLKDLIAIYRQNPVYVIKKALVDLNILRTLTCISPIESVEESDNNLREFLFRNNIE